MKLASLKHGRDGRLVVVSQDLHWFTDAFLIAPTLQAALDDWDRCGPRLHALAESLEHEAVPRGRFHERDAASPLPRAYQWADGSAYVNHVELVRRARGAEMPASFWTDPLMYQGGSDGFLAPRDPIPLADPAWGCDLEAEIVVVTGDVPQGATRDEALAAIRLVGLVNDVSLRNLIPAELAKGFGFVQSKPASALSPVFVTPDALGDRFRDGKLHGELTVQLNGQPFGRADAGVDMTFDFGTLIAHLAKTRSLSAGTIIGSGTVSNRDADGGPGKPVAEGGLGYSCIAEVRTVETILRGAAETPFLAHGDTVRIEMMDDQHRSIFGAIEQTVEPLPRDA
ncbi:MAG: fumarylacetoacetate hydrolase family protein [Brevundimonas mediterranea]|jgi:fumarylacetoacetate (FAA) hydrolase|uniref:Fumarylacetoacetate hydrolase family protein n=1 Tax=Brevundimonas mediterranea TaxID=74329 RepID=A0AB37E527_9CAUL|nr:MULTISPECIES: fumarylacetoacetate hydrolase family protein [Brevundimonas]EDX80682.1 fumarylacetoacetate hydrolase family protein, putative [Brevundimonas sp. BAL3]MBA4332338.1 FAA hydrolase family protein [Brevundimonas sp.]OGN47989.1 MAG: 2-keto-4-pentenoate hydratase [Caulobacterales bacterium RIFCSPHIGHO2_12_FULL_68_13]QIH72496.1 fumarylacetoacetate hydrolase family protein [Brevundimonas mediterranea]